LFPKRILEDNVTESDIADRAEGGGSEVLKRLRAEKGMTQADLVERTGLTREYVTMLESAAKRNSSPDVVKRFSKALKVMV